MNSYVLSSNQPSIDISFNGKIIALRAPLSMALFSSSIKLTMEGNPLMRIVKRSKKFLRTYRQANSTVKCIFEGSYTRSFPWELFSGCVPESPIVW